MPPTVQLWSEPVMIAVVGGISGGDCAAQAGADFADPDLRGNRQCQQQKPRLHKPRDSQRNPHCLPALTSHAQACCQESRSRIRHLHRPCCQSFETSYPLAWARIESPSAASYSSSIFAFCRSFLSSVGAKLVLSCSAAVLFPVALSRLQISLCPPACAPAGARWCRPVQFESHR